MFIKELQLRSFRNYESLDIKFDNQVNVIIGENAQGKTNLLEAIFILAFTRSYRTSQDRELIYWKEEFAKITGTIEKQNKKQLPLEIIFHKTGKKAKLNRIEQKKLSDYIGAINVVMFAPEDLSLVKGSPQIRRRFIDMELGQIEPLYIYHLGQYKKVLRQRNNYLKQLQFDRKKDRTFLHILTEQLAEHAAIVLYRRFNFLKLLRKWAIPIHYQISRELEVLQIVYDSTIDVSEADDEVKLEEKYLEGFSKLEENEINRGTTLLGPHRDDLTFFINDKDVKLYGSQGQQRTTALSLKLAEIDLIHDQVGEYPILLLDDVLSELDDFRQSHLLSTIAGKVQTFVSTTNIDGIDHETLDKAAIFLVNDGKISKNPG